MAKDPALLWYWSDWQGGTATFTRHLKGCYMDLLNAQFNNGRLSLAEIKTVLGTDFGPTWPTLQKKFTRDENELFYNARMEDEKNKRRKFTESRRKNLKAKSSNHTGAHMGGHMENENDNRSGTELKDEGPGEENKDLILPYMKDKWLQYFPNAFIHEEDDYPNLLDLSKKIKKWMGLQGDVILNGIAVKIKGRWGELVEFVSTNDFLKNYSISQVNKHFSSVIQSFNNKESGSRKTNSNGSERGDQIESLLSGLDQ